MHQEVKFKLSKSQMIKLAQAHKHNVGASLRLNKVHIHPSGIPLLLTESEISKLHSGKTHSIFISASRIKHGGFLPFLLAALPTIASIIGGLAGVTGIASNIKDMVQGKGACKCGNGFISDTVAKIPLLGN